MADGIETDGKAGKAAAVAEGTLYVIERKVAVADYPGDVWWSVGEFRHTRAGGAIYAWAEGMAQQGSTWDQAVPLGGDYRAIPKSRITEEPVEANVQTVITVGKR